MLDRLIILRADDPRPEDNNVVAGLGAVWIFMVLAVVVIGFSLVKQLSRATRPRTPASTATSRSTATRGASPEDGPRGPTS